MVLKIQHQHNNTLQQQVEQLLVVVIIEFIHSQDQVLFVYLVLVMQQVQTQQII